MLCAGHHFIILPRMPSIENLPGPLMYMSTKIVRYISAGSTVISGSPACITNTATHMVNIIGIRHRRNSAPSMNPNEQIISAKSTSQNDIVPPMPMGSGNVSVISLKSSHLAMPWLIKRNPNIMRAANSMADCTVEWFSGSQRMLCLVRFLDIIKGVSC